MKSWSTIHIELSDEEVKQAADAEDFLKNLQIHLNKFGEVTSEHLALDSVIRMVENIIEEGYLM